jgi:PKD repeat protein
MVTTVIKTIKPAGGGDYTDLNAFELAERQNLVTNDRILVAECYSGGNLATGSIQFDSANWTMDSTHYVSITVANGHEHAGVYDTAKAYAEVSGVTLGSAVIDFKNIDFARIEKLQIRKADTTTGSRWTTLWTSSSSSAAYYMNRCLCVNEGDNEAAIRIIGGGAGASRHIIKNSILITHGTSNTAIQEIASGGTCNIRLHNNTIIGGITGSGGGDILTRNNYIKARPSTGFCYDVSFGSTLTQGADDATSTTESLTVGLRNVAYSTTNFENVTSGSEDLHLKSGSVLIDNGSTLTGFVNPLANVTEDWEGDTRPFGSAYDIGADEFVVTPPVADFFGVPTSGTAPLLVNFTDTSTNTPTSWAWDFGDPGSGVNNTSVLQNPSHTFSSAGSYTISLTSTNGGGSDNETKTSYIVVVPPAPVADFSGVPTSGAVPLLVNFTDSSTNVPTSWAWNFGDPGSGPNNVSTLQNPSHTYSTVGTFTVSLTSTNAGGSDNETKTNYIVATPPPPVANFSGVPTSGVLPLVVNFTDSSSNTPTSWSWDFGDPPSGVNNTSTAQNPSHTYNISGLYTVILTATNGGGSDNETKTNYITVTAPPGQADFTAIPISGNAPLNIQFVDLSGNSPTSWLWDFGDPASDSENTAIIQNPSHVYVNPGVYSITLTATGPDGSQVKTRHNYITVLISPPIADFSFTPIVGFVPLTVTFANESTNSPVSFLWDFGDGATSVEVSPTHIYTEAGIFNVTLTATNTAGSDDKVLSLEVLPIPDLVADFITGSMTSGSIVVEFIDQSTDALAYAWDFGDPGSGPNNVSTIQGPTHTYTTAGSYQVMLTVTHGPFVDVVCKNILVTLEVARFQEIWGTARFANGTPVDPNRVVQTSRTISASEFECGGDSTDSFHVYRTIDDGGVTRYLVRGRGNTLGVPDSGFQDGEPVFVYIGGRLATTTGGVPVSVPFFQTLPSNPKSHIELDLVFPSAVTTISPVGGTYGDRVIIVLTSNVVPAMIWYTTDGSDPVTSLTRTMYTTSFTLLEGPTTIRFYTEDPLGPDEAVREETYIIQEPTVIAAPPPADYSAPQQVVLTSNRQGDVYFRLNFAGGYEKFTGTPVLIGSGTSGMQTTIIQAYVIDHRGRVGPISVLTYRVDLLNPVITSFTLNNGDSVTGSQIIAVQVQASSFTNTVTGLLLSTFPDFSDASVRLYQPEVTFLLPAPDGAKTVYVQVSDQFDPPRFSEVKNEDIILDTEIPVFTLSAGPSAPIGETTFAFTGTKSSNSGIFLKVNGGSETLVIPFGVATTWEYIVALSEGVNTLDFQAATAVNNRSVTQTRTINVILLPSGVTFATTITRPNGTWRVPFVFFDESIVIPHWNSHDFRIIVSVDTGPDPIVLFPTSDAVLNRSVVTVFGTATPGSRVTLKIEPRVEP